jgi:hypothetical protein
MRFSGPLPSASVVDTLGVGPLRIRALDSDGKEVRNGILVVELERGGVLGFELDEAGEAVMSFDIQQPASCRLWVHCPVPLEPQLAQESMWRSRPIAGEVILMREQS